MGLRGEKGKRPEERRPKFPGILANEFVRRRTKRSRFEKEKSRLYTLLTLSLIDFKYLFKYSQTFNLGVLLKKKRAREGFIKPFGREAKIIFMKKINFISKQCI